tara:strand:- start:4228 stop:5046 length:819 start_codon:yes stop_codon:yes gene_type:complete
MKDKLKGFPKIHALMLDGEEGANRKASFIKKVTDLELDYELCEVKRYPDCGTIIEGKMYEHIKHTNPGQSKTTCAVAANHIRMIRDWLKASNKDEEWGVFCEGDVSFETVEHWPFDWTAFTKIIPSDVKVLQMCIMKDDLDYTLQLVPRNQWHWGANMYLVKREYAERMVRRYCYSGNDNLFNLDVSVDEQNYGSYNPCMPEDTLFCDDRFDEIPKWVDTSGMYACPLFIEDLNEKSFFEESRENPEEEKKSHKHTLKLWKEYNKEAKKWNK